MKLFAYIATLTLIMVSCGTDSQHFKLEGRLLNLNQGEFYVYSPDGGIEGFDTIRVEAGVSNRVRAFCNLNACLS